MVGSWGIRLRIRVVFPEPRKPVIIVMGVAIGIRWLSQSVKATMLAFMS